jgi:hypothetical protein
MDRILAQLAIATFADAKQTGLPADCHLARNTPEPRRHVSSAFEHRRIADSRYQPGGVDRSDAQNAGQTSRRLVVARHLNERRVKRADPLIDGAQFRSEILNRHSDARAQAIGGVGICLEFGFRFAPTLWNHDSAFQKQRS